MNEKIKNEIKSTLFCKNKNALNAAFIKTDSFKNSKLNKAIHSLTYFLSEKASLSERVYCILNEIIMQPLCRECGKSLKFKLQPTWHYGDYCGISCLRKNKKWNSGSSIKNLVLSRKEELMNAFSSFDQEIDSYSVFAFIADRLKKTNNGEKHQLVNYGHLASKKEILCSILFLTKDLIPIDSSNWRWSERFYVLMNGIESLHCPICGNDLTYYNLNVGYKCGMCNVASGKFNKNKGLYEKIIAENDFEIVDCPTNLQGTFLLKCTKCEKINKYTLMNGRMHKRIFCKGCEKNQMQHSILEEILKLGNLDYVENDRKMIAPLELDMFFPERGIAIEFNGLFWHSNDKWRHLEKTKLCEGVGIELIQIFEDEWLENREVVKSKLAIKLGLLDHFRKIRASSCEIRNLSYKEKRDFNALYHLQGDCVSKVNYGLFFGDELVSVMTFSLKNKEKKIWELNRFCSKPWVLIYGNGSKLLNHFKKNNDWEKIVSFCDRRWSNGNSYKKLGFELGGICDPNYFYWGKEIGLKRKSRVSFQKHKLKGMKNYDENLSEAKIMALEGYGKIFDCGNFKFVLVK